MKQLLISEELLRQVLKALTDVWGGYELQHQITDSITALRTTLEQPAVQPEKLGSEWVPCMKLPVVVHVRNQRDGERHVSTREGITPVKPDDLIMRGVSGEEYPIGRAIFDQTYTFDIAAQLAPVQEPVWLPMDAAPKDGTHVFLLVEFEDHAMEDATGPQLTIGSNTSENDGGPDEWQFAGWNWEHDCYTQGVGNPVGWLPMTVLQLKEHQDTETVRQKVGLT